MHTHGGVDLYGIPEYVCDCFHRFLEETTECIVLTHIDAMWVKPKLILKPKLKPKLLFFILTEISIYYKKKRELF